MHVRVRVFGKPDTIVVVESKLSKIDQFRKIVRDKFDVLPKLQRLFYGGKLLENGYTFHDYNIKLNDVIQLMVKHQPDDSPEEKKTETDVASTDDEKIKYQDADSKLYAIGDLIDMKDKEQGAWFEGKIIQIVVNPTINIVPAHIASTQTTEKPIEPKDSSSSDKESDIENKPPPSDTKNGDSPKKKKGITKYFSKMNNVKKKTIEETSLGKSMNEIVDEDLLFKIQLEADEDDTNTFCQLKEIRPRARTILDVKELQPGQTVMINHNTEDPLETGYWYDFKVTEVNKLRIGHEVIGTLYLGPDSVPQNDTRIKVHNKIYAIEQPVPVAERTQEDKERMTTPTEKRSMPLNCLTCRDDEDMLCKDCGCYLCSGKELPEKIVLCDECNRGYHMYCLTPTLTSLPEEDWYCPSCKRDSNEVIAPGAAKQTKKVNNSKGKRDWGRGMACVGKTKTCAMPANHFGPIPGIEVGMCWRFRIQLSESGVHRPPVSGIHGRDVEGAYSIVLSGGYEDDVDHGNEFTYTGSGGRDLSGNKRTADQSQDQTLTRENKALARNCFVSQVSEEGGDAGDNWKQGRPVRVVRSYKMMKHFPKYAPAEGIRYDGIYKVVKYYPEKGLSGFIVWKYLLRRDDPTPAPWEPGAKTYPIVYPDGYLEAEAEKKALKERNAKNKTKGKKKRTLKECNSSDSDIETSPPNKKRKTGSVIDTKGKKGSKSTSSTPKIKIPAMFSPKSKNKDKEKEVEKTLTDNEMEIIKADSLNDKLWGECITVCEARGRTQFVEYVTQVFLCIICQEVAVTPVTTPCLHNFCMGCIKLAFKSSGGRSCPACRNNLNKYEPAVNEPLKTALQTFLAGYDAGKK